MLEKTFLLDEAIHMNWFRNLKPFKIEDEANADVKNALVIVADGTVVAVDAPTMIPYLADPEIRKIRYGLKKPPKEIIVTTKDDFYKLLAIYISLEEAP